MPAGETFPWNSSEFAPGDAVPASQDTWMTCVRNLPREQQTCTHRSELAQRLREQLAFGRAHGSRFLNTHSNLVKKKMGKL